jgi:hypothetical protein
MRKHNEQRKVIAALCDELRELSFLHRWVLQLVALTPKKF